jgi:hypothetical protein
MGWFRSRSIGAVVCVVALLGLGGCSRTTLDSLRAEPGYSHEFSTAKAYDEAYRIIVSGFTRCLTGSIFRNTLAVRPRIDQATRTASIAWVEHSLDSGYWAVVDIAATDSGSLVKVRAIGNRGIRNLGSEIERWVSGATDCQVGDFIGSRYPIVE